MKEKANQVCSVTGLVSNGRERLVNWVITKLAGGGSMLEE